MTKGRPEALNGEVTFADFLECVTAKVRRELAAMEPAQAPAELRIFPSKERVVELLEEAHLFNLGEAEDLNKAGEELKEELAADFADEYNVIFVTAERAAEVRAAAGLLDECEITRHRHGLGGLRDAGQPQTRTDFAFVYTPIIHSSVRA